MINGLLKFLIAAFIFYLSDITTEAWRSGHINKLKPNQTCTAAHAWWRNNAPLQTYTVIYDSFFFLLCNCILKYLNKNWLKY